MVCKVYFQYAIALSKDLSADNMYAKCVNKVQPGIHVRDLKFIPPHLYKKKPGVCRGISIFFFSYFCTKTQIAGTR